jgi:hypothetical protein
MQHEFITLDQGPKFVGWSAQVKGTVVCVMTPRVRTDAAMRRLARHMIQQLGGDCAACSHPGCPLNRATSA